MASFVLLALLGCHSADVSTGPEGNYDFDLTVETVEDIPTVLRVTWDAEATLDGAVIRFGPTTDYGAQATADVSGEGPYVTLLLGSKPDTEVHLQVVASSADGELTSDDQVITTGPVPASLPNLEVESTSDDHWQGFGVTSLVADPTAVVFDDDGDYVWWHAMEDSRTGGNNGGVVMGPTALAVDGSAFLTLYNNVEGSEENALYRIALDGSSEESTHLSYAHHDFVQLPDGTVAYLAYDPRDTGGQEALGDTIQELAPDGTITEIFNIWDWYAYSGSSGGGPGAGESWPHGNAIDYLPDQDAYMVGFLTLGAVLLVDRATGTPLLTMGGEQSDVTDGGSTDLFDTQHQFQWLDGSLLVFINGGHDRGDTSYAQEYAIDQAEGTATETWSYHPDTSLSSPNPGDVERLDSGHTLVTFSTAGAVHEVTAEGDLVWSLSAGVSGALSYLERQEDLDVGAR